MSKPALKRLLRDYNQLKSLEEKGELGFTIKLKEEDSLFVWWITINKFNEDSHLKLQFDAHPEILEFSFFSDSKSGGRSFASSSRNFNFSSEVSSSFSVARSSLKADIGKESVVSRSEVNAESIAFFFIKKGDDEASFFTSSKRFSPS